MKLLVLIIVLLSAGCAQKKILKDCEKINGGPFFICKTQTEIR
jgi:hypothetical protein